MKRAKGEVRACVSDSESKASALRRCFSLFCEFLLLFVAILPLYSAYATTYTYDPAGRLKSATNSQGQTATYDYDSRGNLLRIERTDSAQLAIASFTPNNGPPGIQVTINGSGFASSTSSNTVTFNGVAAPVLFASPTQMLVQVPQNTSTGPIAVTVAGTTVTSADSFFVSTIGAPPVITSFSPNTGTIGTTVTLVGQNLNPIDGETTVTVDGIFVPIATIDDLGITFQIPPWVGSGPISVETPYGLATTSAVFFVVPTGIDPGSTSLNPSLAAGGTPVPVSLSGSAAHAAFLFNGVVGEYASLQASAFSNPNGSVQYSVYSPSGASISAGQISAASPTVHLPPLYATGTYSVFLGQAAASLQLSFALEADSEIVTNGSATNLPASLTGQSKRLTFTAGVGENLGLGISNLVANNANGLVQVTVYKPDTTTWQFNYCYAPHCNLLLFNAPINGVYTVEIAPYNNSTATFSLSATLSDAVVMPLPATVTPTTMNLSRFGQTGIYTFSGMAGQQIALQFAVPSGNPAIGFQAYNPDGSTLIGAGVNTTNTFNLTLSQTGIYTIDVWLGNNNGTPSSVIATLGVDPAPAAVSANGDSTTTATQVGGQYGYFTFNASAGENLGLGISNLVINGAGSVLVSVNLPNGALWQSNYCNPPHCDLVLFNAPATGTYTVKVDPNSATATFSFTATLSDALVLALPATGMPTTMNLSRFGQTGIYTFSGTAGQQVVLQFTVPSGSLAIGLQAYNPDGSTLIGAVGVNNTNTYNLTLAQTGTYTVDIWLGNNNGTPSSVIATLGVDPAPAAVSANGDSTTTATQVGGQYGYFTFNASAGENLGLGISNLVINGAGSVLVSVNLPNGALWQSNYCNPPHCDLVLFNAPATGTYTVKVDPNSATATFSFTATLSDALVLALPATGMPTTMNLSRFGQTGIYTFSGTAGQQVVLQFTVPSGSLAIGLQAYNPDGSTLIGAVGVNNTNTYNLTLAQTGTYTVDIWLGNNNGTPSSVIATLGVSANFIDVIGHAVTVHNAVVTNANYKFGASPNGVSDPNFSAVKLLMHFEQPAVSASSGSFKSSDPDWLTIADSSDFDVGSGDFTWEAWVYPTTLSGYNGLFGKRATGSSYAPFEFALTGGGLAAWMSADGANWTTTLSGGSGMTANVWHHVMASRVSGTLYIGVDGNIVASASANFTVTTTTAGVSIGALGVATDSPFNGYIDEVRFTKGVGRYSGSTYPVPTTAFPNQ